jgi:hypothetical protein
VQTIGFRRLLESDKTILAEWIKADPEHAGLSPDFFYANDKLAMVLEADQGPGLYLRLDPESCGTVRLHIQFGPNRRYSAITLRNGWPIFKERVLMSGKVARLVFESTSSALIRFCERFGFRQIAGSNDYELLLGKESNGNT